MNRTMLQRLSETRLLDAKALLEAGRFDAAYYLAGYVIECALKACIAKNTREHDFPPKDTRGLYQHELESLAKAAGISDSFAHDRGDDALLDQYWGFVKDWKPDSRYEFRGAKAVEAARALMLAIEDQEHGVLQCLSKYW
jgi:HEPN domain-containing protein